MIGNNEFIQECKKDKVSYREYIIINGLTVDVKTEIYQTAYKDTHFIGTFNLSYIKFKTENNIDYKKKEFDLYKEVNGLSQKIGHFYVTEVNDNDTEEEVEITAFDNGIKCSEKYTTRLNYSTLNVTLFQVLQEACINSDLTLENQSITNGEFKVTDNQFEENTTNGDVICAIAQISGNFAFINYKGNLELRFKNDTDEVIEDYEELEDKRDTHPITSVKLGMADIEGEEVIRRDTKLIEQYGEHWLVINDNPFAYTPDKRNQLIDAIFNKVKGFGYSSFTSKGGFTPYFELGDGICFKNKNNQLISSIILRIESKYDNTTVSAPSVTNAEVEYKQASSDIEILRNTKIEVDKSKQQIQNLITQVGDRSQKTTTITQDIDGIESKVEDIEDLTEKIEGITTVELDECIEGHLIELHIYGNNTVFDYLYPADDLYPANDLYPYGDSYIIVTDENGNSMTYDLRVGEVLRQNGNVQDEYVLVDGQAKVIRRINRDGTIKQEEEIQTIGKYTIYLKEGTNTITIKNYDAKLEARYVKKNDYTDTFATNIKLEAELALKVAKNDNNQIVTMLNASADEINLKGGSSIKLDTAGKLIITSGNFKLDEDGTITAVNANLSGTFTLITQDNKKSLELAGTSIQIYDWSGHEQLLGTIGAVHFVGQEEAAGINLYCTNDSYFFFGVDNPITDDIATIIRVDKNAIDGTPYIRNTANGTILAGAGGGIEVENGLIKDWSLSGVSGRLFTDVGGGIEINEGLITGWSLSLPTFELNNVTITDIKVVEGFVTSISYIQN